LAEGTDRIIFCGHNPDEDAVGSVG
jgi:nanoRNase/pAp phosphatase (c-di-AMP/oligoRNAs hydrolase)